MVEKIIDLVTAVINLATAILLYEVSKISSKTALVVAATRLCKGYY